ncbi:acyl-protein thioesterase 1-like [Vespula maculifrons]|uniref:palmitoyl-protein hydrolase n=1 Tax=Vespula maculifrons TaxID=7453 RepID=A0ABD2BWT2_VESMC
MSSPVIISAATRHTATLIFFHGLGDTGNGWASPMAAVRPSHVKVICPTAPTMPVTLNAGFRMPSWFDLRSLDPAGPEDEDGIRKAAEYVRSLIAQEVAAGGFSQGGALAMYSALTYPEPLAGIIALSSWLPLHQKFPGEALGNKNTPLLQCHGDCDPIVPYKWGQMTASLLKQFMSQTEFKTYRGMMHTSSEEEMRDVKKFLNTVLKPKYNQLIRRAFFLRTTVVLNHAFSITSQRRELKAVLLVHYNISDLKQQLKL